MRIAIVNDTAMAVEAIRRTLAEHSTHVVCWVATTGKQAIQACAADTPDLILMDLIMPDINGVEATRQIMQKSPCAILIVTANVGASASEVFDAMGCGALDAIDTPTLGAHSSQQGAQHLLQKLEAIERLLQERPVNSVNKKNELPPVEKHSRNSKMLVAIGASAGGPAALATILRALPKNFAGSLVIVQHIDVHFAQGMADWLNHQCALPTRLLREGDIPAEGSVLLAGTEHHVVFKSAEKLGFSVEPKNSIHKPSIDVFLESLCKNWQGRALGVLLTGMGRDGARGLKAMRDRGFHTIAQDQTSSAVFGMPKAAAALDAATEILAVDMIATKLVSLCGKL